MTGLAGPDRQPDREVGPAGAGWAEEDHVLLCDDEVRGAQVGDQVPFEPAGVVEVELLQALAGEEPGSADPALTVTWRRLSRNYPTPSTVRLVRTKSEPALDIRAMFHRFADAMAVKTGTTPDKTSIADAVTAAHGAFITASGDVALERAAFDIVTHEFEKTSDQPIDRELVCTARTTVAVEALPKAVASVDTRNTPTPAPPIEQLEVEVVAIYW